MNEAFNSLPLWFNILITIYLYWYLILPGLLALGYFIFIRLFAMPLLTRNPHELIIIFGPTKATVIKVVSKNLPYFKFRNGLYWFAEPHRLGHNLLHIYFEGINQPITSLERNQDKESHILSHRELQKQVSSHSIVIPPSFKSFVNQWVLVIERDDKSNNIKSLKLLTAKEAKIPTKQHYKLGLLRRIGLYEYKSMTADSSNISSSNSISQLQTVTVQMVEQKIGSVIRGTNFSSSYMFKLLKKVIFMENKWQQLLAGAFNPILILVIVGMILAIMAVWMFNPTG